MIQPPLDERGLPPHGASWGERNHIVLRATSRGPGVPVHVRHPRNGAPPTRVISGNGQATVTAGKLILTPDSTPVGEEFVLTVEV